MLRSSIDKIKENGFELTKKRSRRCPSKNNYRRRLHRWLTILANTSTPTETQLRSLERAAAGTGLYMNAHKTEYMCFNQTGDISTLGGHLPKFTYQGSSVSSIEKDIDTRLIKAWTAIDSLSVIWKLDLAYKIKRSFFPGCGRVDTAIWMHYMDAN